MTFAWENRGKWLANVKSAPLDTGLTFVRTAAGRISAANGRMGNAFKGWMPTGLFARALLIVIVPMGRGHRHSPVSAAGITRTSTRSSVARPM